MISEEEASGLGLSQATDWGAAERMIITRSGFERYPDWCVRETLRISLAGVPAEVVYRDTALGLYFAVWTRKLRPGRKRRPPPSLPGGLRDQIV